MSLQSTLTTTEDFLLANFLQSHFLCFCTFIPLAIKNSFNAVYYIDELNNGLDLGMIWF